MTTAALTERTGNKLLSGLSGNVPDFRTSSNPDLFARLSLFSIKSSVCEYAVCMCTLYLELVELISGGHHAGQ